MCMWLSYQAHMFSVKQNQLWILATQITSYVIWVVNQMYYAKIHFLYILLFSKSSHGDLKV